MTPREREAGPTDYATWTEKIVALGVLMVVAVFVVAVGYGLLTLWLSSIQYIESAPVLVP